MLSATCAALSTTFKHYAAARVPQLPTGGHGVRQMIGAMIVNPIWLIGLLFDVGAIAFQVLALKFGYIAIVQPLLTSSLAISLLLTHIAHRSTPSRRELRNIAVLVTGLVLFILASDISGAEGEEAVGSRTPAMVMAVIAVLLIGGCWVAARHIHSHAGQLYGLAVAALYVATASLIKSCTRIYDLRGLVELLLAWQLWALLAAGALAMLLAQLAFASGPLTKSLPVIASFDPLFALAAGIVVYGERLSTAPLALIGSGLGLAMLIIGVRQLSLAEAGAPATPSPT